MGNVINLGESFTAVDCVVASEYSSRVLVSACVDALSVLELGDFSFELILHSIEPINRGLVFLGDSLNEFSSRFEHFAHTFSQITHGTGHAFNDSKTMFMLIRTVG